MAESTEDIKGFLMRVKEESEKNVLKLNIQKTKNMTFSFITLWQIEMKKSGSSGRFFFPLGFKITVDDEYGHEIKRYLLLGRKAMTNLDSVLKSKDITSSAKVHIVKVMIFPAVIYGYESWTIKKAEHQRLDAFEFWCQRRLYRVLGAQGDLTSQP